MWCTSRSNFSLTRSALPSKIDSLHGRLLKRGASSSSSGHFTNATQLRSVRWSSQELQFWLLSADIHSVNRLVGMTDQQSISLCFYTVLTCYSLLQWDNSVPSSPSQQWKNINTEMFPRHMSMQPVSSTCCYNRIIPREKCSERKSKKPESSRRIKMIFLLEWADGRLWRAIRFSGEGGLWLFDVQNMSFYQPWWRRRSMTLTVN